METELETFTPHPPRQSDGGVKFIQDRSRLRSPLWKTTALEGEMTFGHPFFDSGVAGLGSSRVDGALLRGPGRKRTGESGGETSPRMGAARVLIFPTNGSNAKPMAPTCAESAPIGIRCFLRGTGFRL